MSGLRPSAPLSASRNSASGLARANLRSRALSPAIRGNPQPISAGTWGQRVTASTSCAVTATSSRCRRACTGSMTSRTRSRTRRLTSSTHRSGWPRRPASRSRRHDHLDPVGLVPGACHRARSCCAASVLGHGGQSRRRPVAVQLSERHAGSAHDDVAAARPGRPHHQGRQRYHPEKYLGPIAHTGSLSIAF